MSDAGLFGPESVTWRVHSSYSMLYGGLSSLMIESLWPRVMLLFAQNTASAQGRLERTIDYVLTATYGTTAQAEAAGATVRRIHTYVRATDPTTGEEHRADEPELLAWIHNVMVFSYLRGFERYEGRLADAERDTYVAEMVRFAELVGLGSGDVPGTWKGLRDYVQAMMPVLEATPEARMGFWLLLFPPRAALPPPVRAFWQVPAFAAVDLLPAAHKQLLGVVWPKPVELGVRLGAAALHRLLQLRASKAEHLEQLLARVADSPYAARPADLAGVR